MADVFSAAVRCLSAMAELTPPQRRRLVSVLTASIDLGDEHGPAPIVQPEQLGGAAWVRRASKNVAKEPPQPAAPKAPETIEEQICSALKRGAKRPSQVATAINRPVSIVNARMLEMLRAGLLTRTGEGRAVVYQIVGSA